MKLDAHVARDIKHMYCIILAYIIIVTEHGTVKPWLSLCSALVNFDQFKFYQTAFLLKWTWMCFRQIYDICAALESTGNTAWTALGTTCKWNIINTAVNESRHFGAKKPKCLQIYLVWKIANSHALSTLYFEQTWQLFAALCNFQTLILD